MRNKNKMKAAARDVIDMKRSELLEEAKKNGINNKEVLRKSEELDKLIIKYMK
ncbi:aspartyl-phosphate phosphatase Spo0E family protein [Ornithinibacillus californiensis]|uniref:aspartyl-phosphate phosphatase Spo0E family protein n=1 Tax=Ornithinibacillus californiensis TaxID=161536 RepID=UPI000A006C44|nr:aspartyl-phosphate phosphatase Spo0E family protein [Ornithinibacillus californiensis]